MPPPEYTVKEMMPSFFDRLVDAGTEGPSDQIGYSVEEMVDAVRTDLEDLFNTHQAVTLEDSPYVQVRNSLVTYGLPDFPSIPHLSGGDASESLGRLIEDQISRFEPRIRNVRAMLVDLDRDLQSRRVQFHIEGRLSLDPAPEIAFETVLELATGQTTIRTTTS